MGARALGRAAVVVVALSAGIALAQAQPSGSPGAAPPIKPVVSPGLIDSVFTDMSLHDAKQESIRRERLLVVVDPLSRFYNEATWKHPSVRAFVMWKAIVIKVPGSQSPARNPKPNIGPAELFIGGERVENNFVKIDKFNKDFMQKTQVRVWPIGLLLGMDLAIEMARTRDPLWGLRHDDKNPMPPMPDREPPLFDASDGVGVPVDDLTRSDGLRGVLKRLEEAREAASSGDRDRAIGLYTWLMERSAEIEPSFNAARLFVVAPEFAELASKHKAARSRAAVLFERASVRMPWAGPAEWFELTATAEAAARTSEVVIALEEAINEPYEAAMLSGAAMTELKLIASRLGQTKEVVGSAEAILTQASSSLRMKKPGKVRQEDWDQLQATRKWLILVDGSRAYGALLAQGKDDAAGKIATIVREVHGLAGTRSLITTALAVNQTRAQHLAWLDESGAAKGDALRAILEERAGGK
ncbi:MAG: hypothetical protein K2X32_09775 [Phycisphaerales bacterium]|nr:hypothetical protein [Phycisphaerales bacterium]